MYSLCSIVLYEDGFRSKDGYRVKDFFVYDKKEKKRLIESLTKNLPVLRAQAEISQEQLALAVSISRQTYSAIETEKRAMSWLVYMALILYFNSNIKTNPLLHTIVDLPEEIQN